MNVALIIKKTTKKTKDLQMWSWKKVSRNDFIHEFCSMP